MTPDKNSQLSLLRRKANTIPLSEKKENAIIAAIIIALSGLMYAFLLYICLGVLEAKFHTPHFTYFDSIKISMGIFALVRLIKL